MTRAPRLSALTVAAVAALAAPGGAIAQSYQTVIESRRLDRTAPLAVEVEFGVGRFRFGPADGPQLYRVGLTYLDEHFEPDVSYDPDEGRLRVAVEGRNRGVALDDVKDNRQRLELTVTREVPVDLDLTFGAVEAEIEMGGLTLRSARVRTGASKSTVRFGEPNRAACDQLTMELGAADFEAVGLGNSRCRSVEVKGAVGEIVLDFSGEWPEASEMRVNAHVGLGEVRLRVPRQVGVRVDVDRFLAGLDLAGFTKRGGTHFSADYERAPVKLIVDANAAFGNIAVEWIQ